MRTDEELLTSEDEDRESSVLSFMAIDGISRKTAEALYDHGLREGADLAAYTEQEFLQALQEEGVAYPPHMLKRWNVLGQAKALAQQTNTKAKAPNTAANRAQGDHKGLDSSPRRPHEFQFTVTVTHNSNDLTEGRPTLTVYDEWKDGKVKPFDALVTAEWATWILNRARLHLGQEPISIAGGPDSEPSPAEKKVSASPPPEALCDTDIEILDVEASETRPHQRLVAEVCLKASEAELDTTPAALIPFWLQLYVVNRESRASNIVTSEQGQLEIPELPCTRKLEFPIPEPGAYELRALAFLLPPVERTILCRGPKFSVVPWVAADRT